VRPPKLTFNNSSGRDNRFIGELERTEMSEAGVPARPCRLSFTVAVLGTIFVLGVSTHGQSATSTPSSLATGSQTGTIVETHSDKRVVQTGRWFLTRQFTVDFALKCANQTYCGEVTTTVVNEVDDLMASKGHPVELLASGKDIDVTLQNGRRIKAHQVAAKKCMQN
jgi:hypothetical protein